MRLVQHEELTESSIADVEPAERLNIDLTARS